MERTLFVFEGESREKDYFNSLRSAFFDNSDGHVLVSYCNDIYELYRVLSEDEDLDPFEIIRELNPVIQQQDELASLRRDQISQIYLFFDMEPRDDHYSSGKLLDMLEKFNDETGNGKLFISYPMVEALRDIDNHEEYLTRTVSLSDCNGKKYKGLTVARGDRVYQDHRKIRRSLWLKLIECNVKKANFMTCNDCTVDDFINDQYPLEYTADSLAIANSQISKFLPNDEVAVLSAFPIFLADYFGRKFFS